MNPATTEAGLEDLISLIGRQGKELETMSLAK
jgi:hypothetical protein